MLIEDWRQNVLQRYRVPKPVHKRTGFLEEGHKYYHEDDAGQYSLPLKIYAGSQTGLIKDFHEFDTIPEAKKCDTSQALHYGAACFAWDMLGIF
jgi:hypothetical protein